jgi:hypothetical protein
VVAQTEPLRQVSHSSPSGPPAPPPSQPAVGAALPPIRYVNSPQVFLDYSVGQVGPSGVSEVQAFITQDNGTNWQPWAQVHHVGQPTEVDPSKGPDTLRRMTLQVDLPGEGLYGMFLVVKSGVGKSKPPPAKGTPPQVRFEVDLEEPKGNLYAPEIVPGSKDAVVLFWDASDRNLTDTPISLEWAEHPNGPWEGIGPPELPNDGRFVWSVPPKTPPMVYLRLRIRDRAGNVGHAQSDRPISIDLHTPEVVEVNVSQTSRPGTPEPMPSNPPVSPPPTVPLTVRPTQSP